MTDSWDWNKLIPAWDYHQLVLDGLPGWDKMPYSEKPYHLILSIKHGYSKSSRDIAVAWDDLATGAFYYRDITESGLPFLKEGEVYRALFAFQYKADFERFYEWRERDSGQPLNLP